MKYITFAVPCYNSESYMRRCVDSLLSGGRDVEIILINDGSTDRTAEIADEYQLKYPDIVLEFIIKWWIRMTGWIRMPI